MERISHCTTGRAQSGSMSPPVGEPYPTGSRPRTRLRARAEPVAGLKAAEAAVIQFMPAERQLIASTPEMPPPPSSTSHYEHRHRQRYGPIRPGHRAAALGCRGTARRARRTEGGGQEEGRYRPDIDPEAFAAIAMAAFMASRYSGLLSPGSFPFDEAAQATTWWGSSWLHSGSGCPQRATTDR